MDLERARAVAGIYSRYSELVRSGAVDASKLKTTKGYLEMLEKSDKDRYLSAFDRQFGVTEETDAKGNFGAGYLKRMEKESVTPSASYAKRYSIEGEVRFKRFLELRNIVKAALDEVPPDKRAAAAPQICEQAAVAWWREEYEAEDMREYLSRVSETAQINIGAATTPNGAGAANPPQTIPQPDKNRTTQGTQTYMPTSAFGVIY